MQALTAAPRDHLTVEQVTAILTESGIRHSAGLELLNPDLTVVDDITDDLLGGQVERNMNRTPHGMVRLSISRELAWGTALVRPYLTLHLRDMTARWNLGVYALTTPDRTVGVSPVVFDVSGYDRLHLLDRQVAADYTIAAGTPYRAALTQAFTDAGLSGFTIAGDGVDATLPTARTYPLVGRSTDPDQTDSPTTWLRVVNDLLTAINYRGVWADERGRFVCEPYQPPTQRAPEWTFDTGARLTIVGQERVFTNDVWDTPNRWVVRWKNAPEGTPTADLTWQYDLPDSHSLSAASRGLVWPSVVDYDAASRAALVALGERRVALDLRRTERITVDTATFPGAGHYDVFTYNDTAAGGSRKVQAVGWSLPLDGGDVRWKWEVVT